MIGCEQSMELNLAGVKYMNEDCYKLILKRTPINSYTLEQIKGLMTLKSKEPRIPLRLNPGVPKQDIQKAKQMIKTLKK